MEKDVEKKLSNFEDKYQIQLLLSEDTSGKRKIDIAHEEFDLQYSDNESMKEHNKKFDELLEIYVKNVRKNLLCKLICKVIFFGVCVIILIMTFLSLLGITIYSLYRELSTNTLITVMITNLISFLTSFIVLPKIIAQYLFNTKEEKYMSDVIKSIQEHDREIRKGINK